MDVPADGLPLLVGKSLLAYTVEAALAARLVDRVIVSTDSEAIRKEAIVLGVEAPFLRPAALAARDVPVDKALRHCVLWLDENEQYRADVVVLLEMTHPLRPEGLIDQVIELLIEQGLDSVFTAFVEQHNFWIFGENGRLERVVRMGSLPRHLKRPIYKEMGGLVTATRAKFVRVGKRLGQNVGLVPIRDLYAMVDTQDPDGLFLAEAILNKWSKSK